MAQLLTLSKAARLVGVKRDILQLKIRQGELKTFEGLLDLDELLKLYPRAQIEDSAMLERVSHIKASAINKLKQQPDLETSRIFGARIAELRQQLALQQQKDQTLYNLLSKLKHSLSIDNTGNNLDKYLLQVNTLLDTIQLQLSDSGLKNTRAQAGVKTHHVRLLPGTHEFMIIENETILDTALKYGMNIQYGCSDGSCGKCKAQIIYGLTRQTRYHECQLTPAEKQDGYIYTCAYTAISDVELKTPIAKSGKDLQPQRIEARIKYISHNTKTTVLTLKTSAHQRLRFLAGQRTRVTFENNTSYDLAIANCPCEDKMIQLHLPWDDSGNGSHLFNDLKPNDSAILEGPFGDFTLDVDAGKPIIFIAYDTGFSALKSLIEQAISLETLETLHFFWIAHNNKALYFNNLCRAWMDAFDNFHYQPIIIDNQKETSSSNLKPEQFYIQTALEYIDNSIQHLPIYQFYLATPAAMIETSRQFLNARGVTNSQILTTNI